MKILKKGTPWSIECKCTGYGNGGGGCSSLLLIEDEDIYQTSSTDITGFTECYYTFKCPICGTETEIDKARVPSRIGSKVKMLSR